MSPFYAVRVTDDGYQVGVTTDGRDFSPTARAAFLKPRDAVRYADMRQQAAQPGSQVISPRAARTGKSRRRGVPQGEAAAMLDQSIIVKAHERAQRRLRAMVLAKSYGDPEAAETRLYVQSERLVDALLIEAAWEQTKGELDALILDDRDQDEDVAAVYDDRDYLAAYETEAELRAQWGDR